MENTLAVFTGIILLSASLLKAQLKLCQLWKGKNKTAPPVISGNFAVYTKCLAAASTASGDL